MAFRLLHTIPTYQRAGNNERVWKEGAIRGSQNQLQAVAFAIRGSTQEKSRGVLPLLEKCLQSRDRDEHPHILL